MARTKTQKILRYSLYGLLGVVVLGFVSYGFVIRPLQIRNQKQSFDKAEASLDTLATQIQQKIGKADEIKKEKTCDRANLLTEKGPLGCDVSIHLLYKNKDSATSSSLMKTIAAFSVKELRIGSGSSKGDAFIPVSMQRGEQTFFLDFSATTKPSCSFSYSYPATDREFTVTGENFAVGMTCGGSALKEFYPLKD